MLGHSLVHCRDQQRFQGSTYSSQINIFFTFCITDILKKNHVSDTVTFKHGHFYQITAKRIICFSCTSSLCNAAQINTDTFFFLWRCDPTWVMASSFLRFLDHAQRCTTVGMTPLDEWLARRRDLYLTTHNTHNRQTSVPPRGIRTHDLSGRMATGLRLRPRDHWDRQNSDTYSSIMQVHSIYTACAQWR